MATITMTAACEVSKISLFSSTCTMNTWNGNFTEAQNRIEFINLKIIANISITGVENCLIKKPNLLCLCLCV